MVDYSMYKKELEKMYDGLVTVTEYQDVTDPVTHITSKQPVDVLVDEPCRLSHKTIQAANVNEASASSTIEVKLFISPDVNIKPGSRITLTQNGVTKEYQKSGEPAVYPTHQEIILTSFEGWA